MNMKTNIIYATMTKHTKKLAEGLEESLGVKAQNISDKPDVTNTDILIVGAGIYGGKVSSDFTEYFNKYKAGDIKKAIIFLNSCGGDDLSGDLRNLMESKKIKVYDKVFTCKSKFLFFNLTHPNVKDIENLKVFTQKAMKDLEKSTNSNSLLPAKSKNE